MKTYLVRNLRVFLEDPPERLREKAAKKVGLPPDSFSMERYRESIDARKVPLVKNCQVLLHTRQTPAPRRKEQADVIRWETPSLNPTPGIQTLPHRPVIIGTGPCGLFAAYLLAKKGYAPLLLERGKPVEVRRADVNAFWRTGQLQPQSNVQFGEGGAGTFSDGKLTSRSKDPRVHLVLQTFHRFGAPEEILWEQYPHIGTDRLQAVIPAMRREIERLGGEFRFSCTLQGLQTQTAARGQRLRSLETSEGSLPCEVAILAIGHSARDTFHKLHREGVAMENKPFAMGLRIEHPQVLIESAQYDTYAGDARLPRASYRLNASVPLSPQGSLGVYTFCMCPGGQVVNASSEAGRLCVNGMSDYARNQPNANAAVLVQVPAAYYDQTLFAGLSFQCALEESAFHLGGGDFRAPVQRLHDFLRGAPQAAVHRPLRSHIEAALDQLHPSVQPGFREADLRTLFPAEMTHAIQVALVQWERRLPGFASDRAWLTGIEARSSSPLRLLRDTFFESTSVEGLFPAGEGAGYAGGIVSSAIDGLKVAEEIITRFAPPGTAD